LDASDTRRRASSGLTGSVRSVTVRLPTVTVTAAVDGERSPQAWAVLDALDAELAANAEQIGQPLGWSAAERAVLDPVGTPMTGAPNCRCSIHHATTAASG
jgi:hypothetical protein